MKKKILLVILSALTILSAACSANKADDETPFVVPIAMDFDTIAPGVDVAANTKSVLRNMHDALYRYNPNTMEPELSLAESVDYDKDGVTVTFKLKDGITFHNGKEITAEDVVYSFMRLGGYTPDQTEVIDNTWERLLNPSDEKGAGTIRAVDGKTVKFVLAGSHVDSYYSSIEHRFADAFIIPKGLTNDEMEKSPVGAGPYKFVEYAVSDHISFTRFDDYHSQKPQIKNIEFKIYPDTNAQYLAFKNGEIDYLALNSATYDEVKAMEGVEVAEGLSQDVRQIWLNQREGSVFSDIRLRQAVNYAIDKQRVLEVANGGRGITLDTHLSPNNPAYNKNLKNIYKTDKEKAKMLLKEAGYPDGLNVTYAVSAENQLSVDIATVVKDELAQVGINAEIKAIPWAEFYPTVYQNYQYEMAQLQIVAYPDAYRMLSRFMIDSSNVAGAKNPGFDEVLLKAASEKDTEKQYEYYREAQQMLVDDATNVFIMDQGVQVALSEGYKGYVPYPFAYTDISLIQYK